MFVLTTTIAALVPNKLLINCILFGFTGYNFPNWVGFTIKLPHDQSTIMPVLYMYQSFLFRNLTSSSWEGGKEYG